jgi:transcriptional regulator with XRE-family HTH domain
MTSARQDSETTTLRVRLGARLRRLRKARNVTREAAGWAIRASESKISRLELGRVPIKERDVADLLTLYRVGEAERAAILALARRASTPAWWQEYGEVVPPWFLSYLCLEEAATLIREYEVQLVPGLLQTSDYARAVIQGDRGGVPAAEVDRRIELRRGRQKVLRRADPPQLWAVLDEAVLRRRVGGPEVMRAQLAALIEATELPHVQIQIVPFGAGRRVAAGFPFAILRFLEPELPDVVYVEHLTSALYLDQLGDVDEYARSMGRACVGAEPPDRAPVILAEILSELTAC